MVRPARTLWALTTRRSFAPAVHHARDGVPVAKRTAEHWAFSAHAVLEDPALVGLTAPFSEAFLIGGLPPRAGQTYRNADLANTFEAIGEGGRKSFYEGAMARQIIEYLRSLNTAFSSADFTSSHFIGWHH